MKIQNSNFLSIEQLQSQFLNAKPDVKKSSTQGVTFRDVLNQKAHEVQAEDSLKFSKHATGRLADRNIQLTDTQLNRLNEGAQKACAKGIHESLVIVDSLAFIVNIPNSTVITAMDKNDTSDNVFTNIDGAVIT